MIKYSSDSIHKFWVGLMDGYGSVQVNHWRKKSLQYRIVIKLKYNTLNSDMLNLIKFHIGGYVRIINNNDVIWVVDDRKTINKLITIFNRFPPLTTRLRAQVRFLCECLEHKNVETYLNTRDSKYINPDSTFNINIDYFNEWLSGFIEAEGCFCLRKSNNHSFSIGLKNDKYLLEAIANKFNITNKIRVIDQDFYFLEVYKKSVLLNISNHILNFPLLGDKSESFSKFLKHI